MDVGKLGETKLDEITNNAFHALTSVSVLEKPLHIRDWNFIIILGWRGSHHLPHLQAVLPQLPPGQAAQRTRPVPVRDRDPAEQHLHVPYRLLRHERDGGGH